MKEKTEKKKKTWGIFSKKLPTETYETLGFVVEAMYNPSRTAFKCFLTKMQNANHINEWIMARNRAEMHELLLAAIKSGAKVAPSVE